MWQVFVTVLVPRHPRGGISRPMGKTGREIKAVSTLRFLEIGPGCQCIIEFNCSLLLKRQGQETWHDKARIRSGASATQSHVEWKLFSSEPKCQTQTTHRRKRLWFGATTRVKRLSLKLLKSSSFPRQVGSIFPELKHQRERWGLQHGKIRYWLHRLNGFQYAGGF